MTMFLTEAELQELTECVQPEAQRRWLTARGWPFEISSKGRNRVLRSVMERQMGIVTKAKKQAEPDFSAVRKAS